MTRWNRPGLVALAAGCLLVAAPAAAQEAATDPDSFREARDTLSKWVETQRAIAKEKEDWRVGRELLEHRIELLRDEIAQVESKLEESRHGIGDTGSKRSALEQQKRELVRAARGLDEAIVGLETKVTGELLPRLPDPIRDKLRPLTLRIPEDPGQTEQSLSQRFQNVIGILNEVNKFNRDITVTPEVRTMPDGSSAEVQTLYIGLGQAYYVTSGGDLAGYGRPGAVGWEWTPANALAPRIAQAIAILKNEEKPAYVPLPVEIR